MKLYMFQCGTIRTKKHLLVAEPEHGGEIEVPVPFFLIVFPKGNVLFDTGQPLAAVKAAVTGNYIPVMSEVDFVSRQLEEIGLKTTDITHIVLSHLHADHAGGLEAFSGATCYLQEKELENGNSQIVMNKYPLLNWHIIRGDHDIFGDGSVRIVFTPGHTAGHQSLLVKLEKTGEVMLTSDSVYTDEILNKNVLPGVFHNREDTARTIETIKEMRRSGIRIITGHDPESWANFRLAPAYYE